MFLPLSKIAWFSRVFVVCIFLHQQCLSAAALKDETDDDQETKLCDKISSMEAQLFTLKRYVSKMQHDNCPIGGCPVGSVRYGNMCLLYVLHKKSWKDAAHYCASMAGKMVSITSKRTQRRIKKFFKEQLGQKVMKVTSVYTGLVFTHAGSREPYFSGNGATSGKGDGWYWHTLGDANFTRLEEIDFTNWADYHPHPNSTNIVFAESCMHLEGTEMKWVSSHCSVERYFICEFTAVCEKPRRKGRAKKSRRRPRRKQRRKEGRKRDRKVNDRDSGQDGPG